MGVREQFGSLWVAAAGALAAATTGLAGISGKTLFDFALNPHATASIMARVRAGEAEGLMGDLHAADPLRREAHAWFEAAKRPVRIPAPDGGELHGWFLPTDGSWSSDDGLHMCHASSSHRYAIVCHGYAGRPSDMAPEAYRAQQAGVSVLVPAARGHERNDDRYVGMGWLDARDLLNWIDMIVAGDHEARIALFGVSMGGAEVMMASGLELPSNVRCIVEDCGYTSVWDEFAVQMDMQLHLPAVPLLNTASAVCRLGACYGFKESSAVRRLRHARVPMLFIHGTADAFVPFRMLDEVYAACVSPVKERLVVDGAGHGLSSTTDPARYWDTVGRFLGEHLA